MQRRIRYKGECLSRGNRQVAQIKIGLEAGAATQIAGQKEKCTLSFSVGPTETRNAGQGNSPSQHEDIEAPLIPAGRLLPFILVTALFFLWGVPNNFNDILIRQFMKSFEINRLQAGLVQFAFYLGYFLLAMPAAQLMRRAGYKAGILVGLCLYGAGCLLFWPAAIRWQVLVLFDGAVCDCQRAGVSRDGARARLLCRSAIRAVRRDA